MRLRPIFVACSVVAACVCRQAPARAQVTDAERAAARDLFKSGDELQRGGRYAEALDKFQRAQQVFRAPTNLLRIAECEAALGRLVEAAEAFREVARAPLPADAPPAFRAAVDQAATELAQVEPRVPKVVVQVQPAGAPGARMEIDGQTVPGALIGEPMPLDPGPHTIVVRAPGYAGAKRQVVLAEHETSPIAITLAPTPAPALSPTPAPASTPTPTPTPAPEKPSREILLGVHFGGVAPGGTVPAAGLPFPDQLTDQSTTTLSAASVASAGLVYGVDGGVRFTRHWYLGLSLEHAALGDGRPQEIAPTVSSIDANTTMLDALFAFVLNPDRVSFYADLGLGVRWLHVTEAVANRGSKGATYDSGELALGAGLWIPVGRSFRLIPKASLTTGSFAADAPGTSDSLSSQHVFVAIGVAGLYALGF